MWIYLTILAIVGFCLVAGIVKCWSIAHRPTANTKCVSALMVMLIGWLLSFIKARLTAFAPMAGTLDLVFSLAAFGLCMAAAVLAVAGLREYSQRPKRYKQGKIQAIWTIALSVVIMAALTSNVAKARSPPRFSNRYLVGGRPLVFEELNFKFLHP